MKFLKNIAMAALVTTALSAGAMAAAPDLKLEANGGGASRLKYDAAVFEAVVNGTGFGGGSSDLAVEIATRASNKILADAKALDATLDANDKVIALVKGKIPGAVVEDLDFNAMLDKASASDEEINEAANQLAAKIIASLDLKDKDMAAIEELSGAADFDAFKGLKVQLHDGRTMVTLEELAKKPENAKGATVAGKALGEFRGQVAIAKKIYQAQEKEEALVLHEAEHKRYKGLYEAEKKKPKEDADQKASHELLADFGKQLEAAGFTSEKELPGWVKDDAHANLKAFFQLNVKLATQVGRLTKQLKKAIEERDAALADLAVEKAKPRGPVGPHGIPSMDEPHDGDEHDAPKEKSKMTRVEAQRAADAIGATLEVYLGAHPLVELTD